MNWLSSIACLGISLWLIWRYFAITNLSKKQILGGYLVKLGFAILYILLFTYYFSDGTLYGDSARFFLDSQTLQSIFHRSPSDFFRLIVGLDPLDNSSINLIAQTNIWADGNTTNWINDNRLILKISAFIHFFSFGNIYVHALIFGFISYVGIFLTYRTFEGFVFNKSLFWWCLIAFPNLALWGSGFLKEALFIFGFGLWCWSIYQLFFKRYHYFILIAMAGCLLVFNKPYAGLIIIGFSLFLLAGKWLRWSRSGLIGLSILSMLFFYASLLIPGKQNVTNHLSLKQTDFNNLAKGGIAFLTDSSFCVFPYDRLHNFELISPSQIQVLSLTKGEYKLFGKTEYNQFTIKPSPTLYHVYLVYEPSHSYDPPTLINGSINQLFRNSGKALLNVFIRPFPTDSGDPLKNLNFMTNLALMALLLFAVIKRKKINAKESYLLTALIGASLIIALIIGWSVPVFGAIVRYKIPVELLLIIFTFIILKPLKNENA